MRGGNGSGAAQIWTATLSELLALTPPQSEQQLHKTRASFNVSESKSKHLWATTVVGKQNWKWIILLFDTRRPNKSSANLLSGLRSGE